MKSNVLTRYIFLFYLALSLIFISSINYKLRFHAGVSELNYEYRFKTYSDNEILKISKTSESIHINNNWSDAKAAGIVTGSGNYSDPYVLKNLVIDAGGSGGGIFIENSNVHFLIENCTVFNWGVSRGGIELSDVTNAKLINNNCSNNYRGIGIYLHYSNNNTISGNTLDNIKYGNGIEIIHSDRNNIFANNVNKNWIGIRIDTTSLQGSTIVSKNNLSNNNYGIFLARVYNTTVFDNFVNNSDAIGIRLSQSHGNTLLKNIVSNNEESGVDLSYCALTKVEENMISNNQWGIYLSSSVRINLEENRIENNQWGIFFSESNSNSVIANNLFGNTINWEEVDSENNQFEKNNLNEEENEITQIMIILFIFLGLIGIMSSIGVYFRRKNTKEPKQV